MLVMIDNYDSFTYNLVQYFEQCGEAVDVKRNDEPIGSIDFGKYTGIILSPGPSVPENSGITLDIIERHSDMPILGVCLGMQAIAFQFGGKIIRAKKIMHGKIDTIRHFGADIFSGIPESFSAVRYHSLVASTDSLPGCFDVTARSSDDDIMGISHREKYIRGIQFHPESYLTEHGMKMIKNFIGGAYERKRNC
jgi:anthranilate synthase/aminodeoxychorismate synthase-like glutamine amidotransferase